MRSAWLLLAAALLASGSITDRLWVSSQSLADDLDLYLEGQSSGDVPVDDEDGDDDGSGSGSGDYALHPLDDKDEALKRFLDISTTLRKTTRPVEPQTTASSPPSSPSVAPERPRDGEDHRESREPQTARPTAAAASSSPPSEAPPSATSGARPTATRAEERDVAAVPPGDGELTPDAEDRSDSERDAAQDGRGSRTFDVKHAEEVTSENLWERTEVLAAVIACVVVGFLCAVFLLLLLAYRMKKKDEGSYDLGDTKLGAGTVYQKAPSKEFYA